MVENPKLSSNYNLMNRPILSSQEVPNDSTMEISEDENDLFIFENLLDVLFNAEKNELYRHILTEESIFLLSSPENKKE